MSVRIGLLGAGFMGSTHAAAYSRIAGARLVAIGDANVALADNLAAQYGARAYYSIDSLLADPDVEAVDVCLPTFLHEQCVLGAARQGKHVFCEKPVALSLEQVDRMLAAVEAAGVMSMVGQVIRFWPEYVAIRDLFRRGDLGEVRAIHALRLSPPPAWGNWFKDPARSGGAVLDLHVHDLDFIYWLCGLPKSVYAVGLQNEMGAWDHLDTSLAYPGACALAQASFMMPDNYPFQMLFRLMGSAATVEYRFRVAGQVGEREQAETELVLYRPRRRPEPVPFEPGDAYERELAYWVGCLESGRPPEQATLLQAREVLRMALAARRSLESGQPVAP